MEPVKIGVIGCGVIGRRNLQDAMDSDLTEVVAVADLRLESREYAQEQGVARIYEGDRHVENVIDAMTATGEFLVRSKAKKES